MRGQHEHDPDRFQSLDGCMRIDAERCNHRQSANLYRQFAVSVLERQVVRALLLIDGDPEALLTLRDAGTVLTLAGMPEGFRLAIVERDRKPALKAQVRALAADLRRVGMNAAVFTTEEEAIAWLQPDSAP